MTKSIAIVGAGPAGLVAAKTFLRHRQNIFDVTVFDKQDRVGGLWAVAPGEQSKLLNPEMPTNLSRYTITFSDLSWKSVNLEDGSGTIPQTQYVPMFPKAWQVGRYLETYTRRYLPPKALKLNCNVTGAELVQDDGKQIWRLTWEDFHKTSQKDFDYLIVTSGFFATPRPHNLNLSGGGDLHDSIKIVHSIRARSLLDDILPESWDGSGDVLVVGGSMSGAEAATALALQLSDLKHSPKRREKVDSKIVQVMPHAVYAIPPFVRAHADKRPFSFAPLDVCSFNIGRRPPGDISASSGLMSTERAQISHKFIQSLVGDQKDLNAPCLVAESTETPAYGVLTAKGMYSELVRDGLIQTISGRVTRIEDSGPNGSATAYITRTEDSQETAVEHVAGVVYATGFSPMSALDFLPLIVKEQHLEFDPSSHRLPIILQHYQTSIPTLPNLGFVGFYEGPYWGIMEMQARLLANSWASASEGEQSSDGESFHSEEADKLVELRRAMHLRDSAVPQYWNSDYPGLMEELARQVGITRNDERFGERSGPMCPARYCDSTCDADQATETLEDLRTTLLETETKPTFVSQAAFRAMHGTWKVHRELNSAIATFPSGTFTGIANFHPRFPTDSAYDQEYLYIESGEFVTEQGFRMQASRRYVFRYSDARDKITSWFVKEDGLTVDYLFLDLEIQQDAEGSDADTCTAKSIHHCSPDVYDARYDWHFKNVSIESFKVVYHVTGPKKDYVSTTEYTR